MQLCYTQRFYCIISRLVAKVAEVTHGLSTKRYVKQTHRFNLFKVLFVTLLSSRL